MGNASAGGFIEATAAYEAWLRRFTPLNDTDLDAKHQAMAAEAFPFLRATFYRWTQLWPQVCADLVQAPTVLSVGDLHAENFGTWRDAEGRLAWGVNDFDETFPLPYTNDLTRLATSVLLAIDGEHLSVDEKSACDSIVSGYTKTLESGGRPFVIDEDNRWFVPILQAKAKAGDPTYFWNHLRDSLDSQGKGRVPPAAASALTQCLPPGSNEVKMQPRRAGVGSLGKPRFVATAQWMGAPVAREVKALTPSACVWSIEHAKQTTPAGAAAKGSTTATPSAPPQHISELIDLLTRQGLRCADPHYQIGSEWITRRLACDSRKIELKASPDAPDELRLLEAMGAETANVHLGSAKAVAAVRNDLAGRGHKWLYVAASAMRDATKEEFKEWSKRKA